MRPFAALEFLLIASLAVALIVKPSPRQVTANPDPRIHIVTHVAATTQSAAQSAAPGTSQ